MTCISRILMICQTGILPLPNLDNYGRTNPNRAIMVHGLTGFMMFSMIQTDAANSLMIYYP